jgi:drug/metabolite transporter (DMT)-like permease
MSLNWFIFASLAVLGSLIYNLSVKVAGHHINPFIFTVALTLVGLIGHLACLAFYKFYLGEGVSLQMDKTGLWLAVAAGLGIVIIDLGYFFAVREGGLMASTGFWVVGSLVITTVASYFLFKEGITATKLMGIVLGAISLFLLTRPA